MAADVTGGAPFNPQANSNPYMPRPVGRPKPQRTTLGPRVRRRRRRRGNLEGDVQRLPVPRKPTPDYEAWAQDPATRPKVPDAILRRINPEAYRQRVRNRQQAAPVVPGGSITNRDLDREVAAAVGERYAPIEGQLAQQYARSEAMQQRIPEWFNYYRQQVQGLGLADAAAAQYAKDQITGLGGALAASAASAAGQDQAAMAADAAIRGATVDPAGLERALQASAVNTADLGTLAALQVQLGKNSGDYWRGQEGVSEQAKVQQLLAEEAVRRQIDEDVRQLAREKGDFATTFRADRTDREHQRALERAAFGLKESEAAADAQQARRSERQRRRKERVDFMTQHGVTPAQYAAMSPQERARNDRQWAKSSKPRPRGDGGKVNEYGYTNRQWRQMTPAQRQAAIREFKQNTAVPEKKGREPRLTREMRERYRSQVSQGADLIMNPPRVDKSIGQALGLDVSRAGTRLTTGEVVEWIRTGKSPLGRSVPPEIVNAARSLASTGGRGLGPWGRQNARRVGGRQLARQFPRVRPKRQQQRPGAGAFSGTGTSGRAGG